MPYTVPLDDPPEFPTAQAPIADSTGKPTPEMARWMNAMREWIERVQSALEQVEP